MDACFIEQIIREAFSKTPAPTGRITNTFDDEGANEYFSGKNWDGHKAKDLQNYESALNFFAPEAFRYYLPSYMLAVLKEPDEIDTLGEFIVYQFDKPKPYWQEEFERRIKLFTTQEKEAILSFLRYMQEEYGDFEKYLDYATLQTT